MPFDKITSTDITQNYVQGAPDFPSGTPQQKKQIFDKLPLKIVERVNALIAKLESSLTGGGSSNVGSPPISGVDGTTVLTQLQSLKQQLTEVVVGTIPDGTITKDKFVDFDGDVMDAELEGYVEAESAADINDTDSVVVALGKLQKTISDLTDALQDYKDDIADGTVVADKAETVTTDLNGRPLTNVFVADTAKVKYAALADEATNATKATNDADNNDIRTTYRKTANRVLWFNGTHTTTNNGTVAALDRNVGVESLTDTSILEIEWEYPAIDTILDRSKYRGIYAFASGKLFLTGSYFQGTELLTNGVLMSYTSASSMTTSLAFRRRELLNSSAYQDSVAIIIKKIWIIKD